MKRIFIILGLGISLAGCSGFDGNQLEIQNALTDVNSGNKIGDSDRPYCEVDNVDYLLDAKLQSFELTDKSNVSFGFNLVSGFLRAFGLSLKTEKGSMTMAMHMSEALRPRDTIANVLGAGESKSTDFKMDIDLLKLGLDIGYYYKTPISKLTEKTIDNSLANLSAAMSAIETKWNTRIVRFFPEDGQLIIPAGTVAGLRVGDTFNVMNVENIWSGTPCESEYVMARQRLPYPNATAEVMQVEKNASLLRIVKYYYEEPILDGAKVEVEQLVQASNNGRGGLLRSLRLRKFSSEPLILPGNNIVDLTGYISEQTEALLNRHGYYSRK